MKSTTSLSIRRATLLLAVVAVVLVAVAPVALGRWDPAGLPAGSSASRPEQSAPGSPSAQPPTQGQAGASPATSRTSAQPAPERRASLELLGQITPGPAGFHADVWAHNGFAYVGTWGSGSACPATGVKIIEITDPSQPRWVATAPGYPATSQEDIVVRSVTTPAFTGDLLVVGIQACTGAGRAGLAVYDVTDPRNPVELAFFASGARGVHELDLVQQGERVLALLAVPSSEAVNRVGDFRIVDLTNPRRPVQLSHWGAAARLGIDLRGGTGCTDWTYLHSARASHDGRRAYLSYWDAGVIVLDIDDPAAPRVLAQLAHPSNEEGATHSVSESADGRHLLVADEYLTTDERGFYRLTHGLRFSAQMSDGVREIHGCEATFGRSLDDAGLIDAPVVDAGSACPGSALAAGVSGRVAVVAQGGCTFAEKAARLAGAGALAVVVGMNGEPKAASGGARVGIPIITVAAEDAVALQGATGATLTLPAERRWGGLRIWEIGDLGNPRQIGTYHTENSAGFPPPSNGLYTIHNPEASGDLAFLSWYTDGLRVVDLRDPAAPRELASFVPPAVANPQRVAFPDGPMVWGVHLAGDLILISDVNSGLYILRLIDGP